MSEAAVENINAAEILGAEGAEEKVEKVKAALEADPEMSLLLKAAETVEDVYEIVKRFSKATFEEVKGIFEQTVDYYKQTKAALSDEMLDYVVGGSFSSWWNRWKAAIVGGVVFVACVAAGTLIGAAVGGYTGAIAGAAIGLVVGIVAGSAAAKYV